MNIGAKEGDHTTNAAGYPHQRNWVLYLQPEVG